LNRGHWEAVDRSRDKLKHGLRALQKLRLISRSTCCL
jgi:hypothetical protein